MKILQLGHIKNKGFLGIRVLIIRIWNPFEDWFKWERQGYVIFARVPGLRFMILKSKKEK